MASCPVMNHSIGFAYATEPLKPIKLKALILIFSGKTYRQYIIDRIAPPLNPPHNKPLRGEVLKISLATIRQIAKGSI